MKKRLVEVCRLWADGSITDPDGFPMILCDSCGRMYPEMQYAENQDISRHCQCGRFLERCDWASRVNIAEVAAGLDE